MKHELLSLSLSLFVLVILSDLPRLATSTQLAQCNAINDLPDPPDPPDPPDQPLVCANMDESTAHAQAVGDLYGARSGSYDASNDAFHVHLSSDFVRWADIQPGQSVLDLACGTGLVTLDARRLVGSLGRVVGVDISAGMLDVARASLRNAPELNSGNVDLVEGDITDASMLRSLAAGANEGGKTAEGFDRITVCSALVLLPSPRDALALWATLLRPGGKIVFDVLTERASVAGLVLEEVLRRQRAALLRSQSSPSQSGGEGNAVMLFHRTWVHGPSSIARLVRAAGLELAESVFESPVYETPALRAEDADAAFENFRPYVSVPLSSGGGDGGNEAWDETLIRQKFTAALRARADGRGVIPQETSLYIAIATSPRK